ncbi:MAG: bifunctional UDP-N-acetylmuramoyl-tripeptide:D-alanyl-D-alanine ligase/alanine racemase [Bacteroidetes bacterium]|nr:bifunctional UDP-N-acetylmuramoyl-tripeptide:D-alanyl-D-alanine ligase/alanine racemase [Bacteroidota bacterium]
MYYFAKDIARILNGTIQGNGNPDSVIRHLMIDSRSLASAETSLFFALKGERHDGHKFIADAYQKRVRNFVVSELPSPLGETFAGCNFVLVKDTLVALQHVCANHRRKFNIPVIGITGSNGKTIVKEWLYQLMQEDKNIVRSPKSYNSQVGVPLSVWQMSEENELAIFEAGISKSDEMEKLEPVISPTIGIITNIGQAHDENFLNSKQKIREKLKLFVHVNTLIFNRDNLELNDEIVSNSVMKRLNLFTWSKKSKANLQIGKITKEGNETELQGIFNNEFIRIKISFIDEASIENAIHCWAVMLFLGYPNKTIAERMHRLNPVAMRLELKEGINNCSVINDSYNSDLGSLAIALDFLNQQKQHSKRTLVLSDILQSGKNEKELYAEVANLVKEKGVSRIIGIGEAISRQEKQFAGEKIFFKTTEEFLSSYNGNLFNSETILLKGARTFGFERISLVLQQKAHETVLEINFNSLVHNLNYYRSKLAPETKIMAMVKAFSYGSGGFEIANVLQYHHADYLAVAYADEGIELRKAGITLPIMVMNPEEPSYDTMIKHNLEPEIFSFRVLKLFEEAVKRRRSPSPSLPVREGARVEVLPNGEDLGGADRYPIHIKLDTGMHRLGFEEKDVNELAVRIANSKVLQVRSVFSHLAGSDEVAHDEFTRLQIKKIGEMSEVIRSHFNYPVLRHILNSAGIVRFPGAQFEMVRLGIGLYGIGANKREQPQLKNVSTLKSIISQIKSISVGESIGYSRKFVAQKDMRIATVPIGYADGLSRRLSNGKGKMIVKGAQVSIVGNVCMDMCMLDVTGVQCAEGDEVIVFGEQYPIDLLANDMDTIPYEVFTGISRRVKRVYFHE